MIRYVTKDLRRDERSQSDFPFQRNRSIVMFTPMQMQAYPFLIGRGAEGRSFLILTDSSSLFCGPPLITFLFLFLSILYPQCAQNIECMIAYLQLHCSIPVSPRSEARSKVTTTPCWKFCDQI